MKLLLFSDLHCDADAARRLLRQANTGQVDVFVGAGDFCNMHRGLDEILALLRPLPHPIVLVPGNAETAEELRAACADWPAAHVLHGEGVSIQGHVFFGIGGAIPVTPFGAWSYDFTEAQAATLLAPCPKGCVLVSHSPPYGAVDTDSQGRHLGSTAVRDAVLRVRPTLTVCGHIHGSAGRSAMLEGCAVVNAGPIGMRWDLDAHQSAGAP